MLVARGSAQDPSISYRAEVGFDSFDDFNAKLQAVLDEVRQEPSLAPTELTVHYRLLFEVDPTHRGLLQVIGGGREQAAVLSREPSALTLRYLQTLVEIGVEKNTTIVFPLPLELLGQLGLKVGSGAAASPGEAGK